jgi:hypothetical protein
MDKPIEAPQEEPMGLMARREQWVLLQDLQQV